MAETIDEVTIAYTDENGQEIVKELDKKVLSKGSWSTVMYLYEEWDRRKEVFVGPKARIERYQKRNGVFRSQSRFKISSEKQARQIMEALTGWFPEE